MPSNQPSGGYEHNGKLSDFAFAACVIAIAVLALTLVWGF